MEGQDMTYPGNDIEGWMSPVELQWLCSMAEVMNNVVEIGAWKGKSTHALLSSGCPSVTTVDHWQGSIDNIGELEFAHKEVLEFDIYQHFTDNLSHFKTLNVMKMPSISASKCFGKSSVDMIFIDGGHTKSEVKADIQAWLPKCKRLLCGHDYEQSHIPEIAKELGLNVKVVAGTIWAVVI
jgi:hypothetical protein